MNAKQSQNTARIPKPWTLKAAFLIIDGTCLLLALICICTAIWNSSPSPLAGLAFPVAFLFCPALVMRGGNSLMRIFFFAIAFLVLLPCFIASQFDWKMILTLPFVALPVLLYMPPSGRWFAAVRQEQGKRPHPLLRELCFGCFTMLLLAFGLLAIFVLIPDIPYMRKRWRYPAMQKDELVAAAGKKEVKRVFGFSQGGTNFTVVVIGHMRWLASGPGVFVFDEKGRRVDHTIDYGDNPSFRERWKFSWHDLYQPKAASGTDSLNRKGKDGKHE